MRDSRVGLYTGRAVSEQAAEARLQLDYGDRLLVAVNNRVKLIVEEQASVSAERIAN